MFFRYLLAMPLDDIRLWHNYCYIAEPFTDPFTLQCIRCRNGVRLRIVFYGFFFSSLIRKKSNQHSVDHINPLQKLFIQHDSQNWSNVQQAFRWWLQTVAPPMSITTCIEGNFNRKIVYLVCKLFLCVNYSILWIMFSSIFLLALRKSPLDSSVHCHKARRPLPVASFDRFTHVARLHRSESCWSQRRGVTETILPVRSQLVPTT